jgi:hypothetical protein
LPDDGIPTEEQDDVAYTLAGVDVIGHVSIVVSDQHGLPILTLGVVQPVISCLRYVHQYTLHRGEVILARFLMNRLSYLTENARFD